MRLRFQPPPPIAVILAAVLAPAVSAACLSAPAFAATEASGWEVSSAAFPTHLTPGGVGHLEINVYNVGAAHSTGPVTVTDTLPPGVTATSAGFTEFNIEGEEFPLWDCTGTFVVTCTNDPANLPSIPFHLQAGSGGFVDEGPRAQIGINVMVAPGVEGTFPSEVTVSGGGAAAPASATEPIVLSSTPASSFGLSRFDGWVSGADGTADTQAGSHPYDATFSFALNTATKVSTDEGSSVSGGHIRRVDLNLPPGLIGNPTVVPECPRMLLEGTTPRCPVSTEIGVDSADLSGGGFDVGGNHIAYQVDLPVYNMVPPVGVLAEYGTEILGIPVLLDAIVRSGGNHGITENLNNLPQGVPIFTNSVTLWGEPADPRHDFERYSPAESCEAGCAIHAERKPFLTLPTSCGAPPTATARATTWENLEEATAEFVYHDSVQTPLGITGCDQLSFRPSMSITPDTSSGDSPAGVTVDVKAPPEGLLDPEGLATSDIKDARVTLPEGVVIDPGRVAGLQACPSGRPTPEREGDALTTLEEEANGEEDAEAPRCPPQSRVGMVQIETPLLTKALTGNVYLMQSNPPNLRVLIAVSGSGLNLKLVADVHLDEATGQLTATVVKAPELPFTDVNLFLSGGAQAALDTPIQCGVYSTTSDFTPWSTPSVADAFPAGSFVVDHGAGGGPCPSSPLAFTPSMIAGSTTDQAGAFTDFNLLVQRPDDQQRIEALRFTEPAGLAGLISSVPLCDQADANAGTCPAASHIGHAAVVFGPGPSPLVLPQPGAPELPIYLTGPYKGAPFGLAIATPVIAGPFNLGTMITRAKIEVDPRTARITITTDPVPQILNGIPTDLRSIIAMVDRPNFLFNPTNCNPQESTGTATSAGRATTAVLSSHFAVGSCRSLEFHPKIAVSTRAKSSKSRGAGLFFNITYPKGALGTESWFNEAEFTLPRQFPARLTTIQKACLASVFEANPAACPPASLIGFAIVHTPVLSVPLAGPVYFVSHGGAKFPDAVIVLQGDGVTVELIGETFINGQSGVTSATFRNTPDVPFESIEVAIPAGPFSEFGANLPAKAKGSFCGQKLVVQTLFKAQNGLEIRQNVRVSVTGCRKAKALTRAQKLAKAMKACKKKPKAERADCARAGRRKYRPLMKK